MQGERLTYKTIGTCFEERVKKTPHAVAAEFEGEKISFQQLDVLSDWLVWRFHSLGMKRGDHAAIWCANHLQWIIVFLGLQKLGAVAVLMNPGYQAEELNQVLSYANVKFLFYGESYKETSLPEILAQIDFKELPALEQAIPIERDNAIRLMEEQAGKMTDAQRKTVCLQKEAVKPDQVACMMFTSGTTAAPKGVMLTHYNLVNDAIATVKAMRWGESDKTCVMVPLFHCFGITSCLIAGIIAGSCLYLMKRYRTAGALEAIQTNGCTVLNGVPSMFLAMAQNRLLSDYDVHTLKSGIIAGSPVSPQEYHMICEKLHLGRLQMSYGQTETSPGVTFSHYEDSIEEKCDNAGYLIDHIEACIWEKDGTQHIYGAKPQTAKSVGQETVTVHGELGIKGFPVMQGYYNRPDETKKVLGEDGWLHTGDMGYFDEKGRLHVEGRIKEIIIRGGENISPAEIEKCLMMLPQIQQIKVVGVPQKVLQEEIAACIVRKPDTVLTEEEIREYAQRHLASYKVPKYIAFFNAFPVSGSGKVKLCELKEQMKQYVSDFANSK